MLFDFEKQGIVLIHIQSTITYFGIIIFFNSGLNTLNSKQNRTEKNTYRQKPMGMGYTISYIVFCFIPPREQDPKVCVGILLHPVR